MLLLRKTAWLGASVVVQQVKLLPVILAFPKGTVSVLAASVLIWPPANVPGRSSRRWHKCLVPHVHMEDLGGALDPTFGLARLQVSGN